MLGKAILNESGSVANNIELDPLDWVCKNCFNAIVYPRASGERQSKYVLTCYEVLEHASDVLDGDGACMISNLMDMYKDLVMMGVFVKTNMKVSERSLRLNFQ